MAQDSPPPSDTTRLTRSINVARVLVISLVLLPLVVLIGGYIFASQVNPDATYDPTLYEPIQDYVYGSVMLSCLLIPVVAFIGMRLTFRKRAITQKVERGRVFLTSLVVWLIYGFLAVALFILWNLVPGV